MAPSKGNIFRVTGPLCWEFTGPGEFPTQRPVTRSFDVFFDLCLNKWLSKQPWCWWFETPSWSLWRQCNDCCCLQYPPYLVDTRGCCRWSPLLPPNGLLVSHWWPRLYENSAFSWNVNYNNQRSGKSPIGTYIRVDVWLVFSSKFPQNVYQLPQSLRGTNHESKWKQELSVIGLYCGEKMNPPVNKEWLPTSRPLSKIVCLKSTTRYVELGVI